MAMLAKLRKASQLQMKMNQDSRVVFSAIRHDRIEVVIEMLNQEARRIEQDMSGSLRLIVRGLDLQPRLPTERAKAQK